MYIAQYDDIHQENLENVSTLVHLLFTGGQNDSEDEEFESVSQVTGPVSRLSIVV